MHTEIPDVIALSSEDNPPSSDNLDQEHVGDSEEPERGQTILVVDDSVAWLRLAKGILTECGYQVETCEDPRDALSLLKQNPEQIDLVITDLQMPNLDGFELTAELLKIDATLPVVLTSAATVQMSAEKLQSLGLRDFLTKPWDCDRLLAVVRQALAHRGSEERN